jgi:CRISPR-associated protein Cmr6
MPSDTQAALGQNAELCGSRSLFMDRFANPGAKDSGNQHPRRDWFTALLGKSAVLSASESRQEWLAQLAPNGRTQIFYAQLQSRLMVNMAGGVMENAGLCLDRFGLPVLPGSAIKGCARRMAIQELLEAREVGKPVGELARLLADIALIFGWGELDWSTRRKDQRFVSDFAYAVGASLWHEVSPLARSLLRNADHFAGSVSFLPAYPVDLGKSGEVDGLLVELPPFGKLELDVLTCHHGKYYSQAQDDRSGKPLMPAALDNEEPVPVVFPTVAAGHVFLFALLPLRDCAQKLLDQARAWLAAGLSSFGLGAKTAAGYGWFESSDKTSRLVAEVLAKQTKEKAAQERKEEEAAAQKAREEADRQQREKMKAALSALAPEQQDDYKVAQLSNEQFRSALDNYAKRSAEEQKAIVRALRVEKGAPGSRRVFWDDLKTKALKKGGKHAQTEQAIRQLSKQLYPGKEGKMP